MVHLYKIKTLANKPANLTKAKEELEKNPEIEKVRLDTKHYEYEIFMKNHINEENLNAIIKPYGIEISMAMEAKKYSLLDFYPLILIFAGILAFVSLKQIFNGSFDLSLAMTDFMAGFFITFAGFKLIDLKGFADAYSTYDIVGSRYKWYSYIYPFLELGLGLLYLLRYTLFFTNIATISLMLISSIGVIQSLLQKRKIRCACLGTKINLPMTTVTLIEDLLMAGMAIVMLFL